MGADIDKKAISLISAVSYLKLNVSLSKILKKTLFFIFTRLGIL